MREDSNREMARCTDLHPLFVALELFIIGLAEEPRYASQCAWVVARLPVHVVTLLKFSELARGVQSPHKDENPKCKYENLMREF